MNRKINNGGVSIIAAVFIIVILAFMGVMFVSLISTGMFTAVNDMQSTQALAIAEGGVEFNQRNLSTNLDWYRSNDPMANNISNLGAGSFTASTTLPATKLRAQVTTPPGLNILPVYSVGRFPNAGCIRIEDEFINYGGVGTTAAACNPYQPPCFTGIVRGGGACFGGGAPSSHSRGDSVYPVSTTSTNLPSNCNDMASLVLTANTKFLTAGTLDIQGEEVSYSGSNTSGGNMTLTGIQRCQGGTPTSGNNLPATPVLSSDQAEIISIGTAGAASRTVKKTVQR